MTYKSVEKNKVLKNKNNSLLFGKTFIKWVLIGSLIGVFIGGVIAFFLKSLEWATEYRMEHGWLLFLLPFGGALVSFLYYKYGRNSVKGNNLIIENINDYCGDVPLRMVPLVFFGTVVTHFFGGSAGREGTGVQIGASIAEAIGKIFKLNEEDSKIMLMAGVGGGFAAIFGTPLAGTVFGLEVAILGKMSYEALIPSFFASVVGNEVVKMLGVHHSHYKVLGVPEVTFLVVLKVIIASICFGLASKLFSQLTHKLKELFSKGFENTAIKSFVGGLVVIILVYIVGTRKYLGLSLPLLSQAFTSHVAPLDFLGKLVFTAVTLGAGYQGGEVTPLFVVGSTLGNTLSGIVHLSPSFLAALGLAAVFAGATNTPIASFILGVEMFGSEAAVYLFMACAISYVFSGHTGIYSSQKIGVSKSHLIELPKHTTLSTYNKKEKVFATDDEKQKILVGQFAFGKSSLELNSEEGMNVYKLRIKGKGARLIHTSYNPDGASWKAKPLNGQLEYIDLDHNKEEIYAISVGKNHDEKDKITILNKNLFKSIEVDYSVKKSHHNNNSEPIEKENDYDIISGQIKRHKATMDLDCEKGERTYYIEVNGGKINLCHNSYNPDGGHWTAPPVHGGKIMRELHEGLHKITLHIGEHLGEIDKVKIINKSIFNYVKVKVIPASDFEKEKELQELES